VQLIRLLKSVQPRCY